MKNSSIANMRAAILMMPLLILAVWPITTSAETVFRYGTDISVATDQVIEGDLYAFSGQWWAPGEVNVSGEVEGDIYGFGDNITINGSIGSDLMLIGVDVQIHGSVDDDVRVIGEKVVVAEPVKGDLFVVAGNLTVLSSATISGNIYFYGNKADIAGDVKGSVHGAADSWRIDSAVGGDVALSAGGELVLGSRAAVAGDVTYSSNNDLVRAVESVVDGDVSRSDNTLVEDGRKTANSFVPTFAIIFAAFFLFLFFRSEHREFAGIIFTHKARNFIVGFVTLLLLPIISVFMILTILGSVLGVGLLCTYILLVVIALTSIPLILGVTARKLYSGKTIVDFTTILLGAALMLVLSLIPIIGSAILFIVFVISLGTVTHELYDKIK